MQYPEYNLIITWHAKNKKMCPNPNWKYKNKGDSKARVNRLDFTTAFVSILCGVKDKTLKMCEKIYKHFSTKIKIIKINQLENVELKGKILEIKKLTGCIQYRMETTGNWGNWRYIGKDDYIWKAEMKNNFKLSIDSVTCGTI